MATDPYSSCPCGSGKKFKWCCQPIHVHIDRAFQQEEEGQYEAALRTMDEVIAANPGNPEALGRKAQLLYNQGKFDEAENTLQQALDINPNYPFGLLLRGLFRRSEGEIAGALLLFRRAAEVYDPQAKPMIARVYELIAECELKLNRPVAARAALQVVQLNKLFDEDHAKAFEAVFGPESRLPLSARREYTLQSPPGGPAGKCRAAWDRALNLVAQTPKLSDLVTSFQQLTQEDPEDAAAWYNLGLTRAWVGDNAGAVEALDNYVARETDDSRAAAAWSLAEVLRCGHGMEDQADYVEHFYLFQMRQPQQVVGFLGQFEKEQRLVGVQVREEEHLLTALVLDRVAGLTPEHTAAQLPRLGAHLLIIGDQFRLANSNTEALDRVVKDLRQRVGPALSEPRTGRDPVPFHEVLAEALVFPLGIENEAEADRRVGEQMAHFYEDTWIHRPLVSLSRIPPVDAAGHATLRKKLLGVIQFLQECAAPGTYPYDFDRLRRKLGFLEAAPEQSASGKDVAAMSTAELAALSPESLADAEAEAAFQAALKLDARDLAGNFARALVSRPPNPERSDRYPLYAHLTQLALAEGDTTRALDYVNEGEKADCEQNEGRRRNDYELRRGQIHAKRGEADAAQDVFERLIARVPAELRYRGSAAEAMLGTKQGARALAFAEQGLAKAREKNDRDSEDYFKELVAAARKMTG
jgi:tetratricopeptide (TPR) repeat protein